MLTISTIICVLLPDIRQMKPDIRPDTKKAGYPAGWISGTTLVCRQSSSVLTVLGHQVNRGRTYYRTTSEETMSETEALTGLLEFLQGTKVNLVINSALVVAILKVAIGSRSTIAKILLCLCSPSSSLLIFIFINF